VQALRIFFLLRQFCADVDGVLDAHELPLMNPSDCVKVNDCIDLSKSDMLACTVFRSGTRTQRYLVTDALQLILVEPDARKLGWGVAQYVAALQDVQVAGVKDDNKSLSVTIGGSELSRFVFEDHIRCMAAKQRLTKGRTRARQYKMQRIAHVLGVQPVVGAESNAPPPADYVSAYRGRVPGYVLGKAASVRNALALRIHS
jgi:protein CLEC16A